MARKPTKTKGISTARQTGDRRAVIIAVLLIVLTAAAFWGVLRCEFTNYDDDQYVTRNPFVTSGFIAPSIKWAFTALHEGTWQPMVWLSYMLDRQVYGLNPLGFHLTNLLLHIANTLLLLFVLRRMTGSLWKSAFVAAMFAIHPLHVESVAWIAERKDVLSTLFWMLTMWAYVRYAELPSLKRYLPVFGFMALGLMSKPLLVTLPFAFLLLDYWPLGRLRTADDGRQAVLEKLPLLALSIGSAIITGVAQVESRGIPSSDALPLAMRLSNAVVSYSAYLLKMLWPAKLAVLYPHPWDTLPEWQTAASGAALLCLTVLFLRMGRARPYLTVGWLWYLVVMLPMIGIVQTGMHAMADRFMYVPMIGLTIMVAWGVPEMRRKGEANVQRPTSNFQRSTVAVVACAVVVGLGVVTWVQVGHWRNSKALFTHALAVTKDNYTAHLNLGLALRQEGKFEEALWHHREATRLRPRMLNSRIYIGIELGMLGRYDEAAQAFQEAIDLDPTVPGTYNNLAWALQKQNKLSEAAGAYRKALGIDPSNEHVRSALTSLLYRLGRPEDAVEVYKEAVRLQPDAAGAYYNLGVALSGIRRFDEAIEAYRTAVSLQPDYGKAHNNLAVVLYTNGDYAGAWQEAHLAERHGNTPHPGFIQALSQKMPDPGNR